MGRDPLDDGPSDWLRRKRTRALLTQEQLAAVSGVDARTIRDIETGRTRQPRASTIRLLTEALSSNGPQRDLGVDVAEFAVRVSVIPRELPPDTRGFVGRGSELAMLDGIIEPTMPAAVSGVICAVSGTAGVGKTALVVHWAHRVADRFPDGQLYMNLRGYDSDPPVTPAAALAALIRSLGVDGSAIPEALEERACRFRSLLADRRMLVVLDNASGVDHIRHLLPGTSPSVVLVTSRDALGGLAVRHGAHCIELEPLSAGDARDLLHTHIGHRVQLEPHAAEVIAQQCAHLPLALRIAAQLANARPALTLTELAAALAHEEERLNQLDAGDPRDSIHAVFSWSYEHLSAPAAEMFRLLGINPGPDISHEAAAALAGTDTPSARKLLTALTRTHLIQEPSSSRYDLHDLLRAYARAQADQDADDVRRGAVARLLDYYTAAAASAMDLVAPYEMRRRALPSREPVACGSMPTFTDQAAALAWLDTERANLIAAGVYAADHGWPTHAGSLSTILYRYLDYRARYVDAEALHGAALRSADPETLGRAMANYGVVHWRSGRYLDALDHYQRTLTQLRAAGDRLFEAGVLGNLGVVYWRLGRNTEALEHYQEASALFRELGDPAPEARTRSNLAVLLLRMNQLDEALENQQQAITLAQEAGDRNSEAEIRGNLGTTCHRLGKHTDALKHYRHSLALLRELGDRQGEAEILNELGSALSDTNSPRQAIARHRLALRCAEEVRDRFEEARAHDGIANAQHLLGNHARAQAHWQVALALHSELRTPQADDIAARLQIRSTEQT